MRPAFARRGLWLNGDFLKLWAAQTISTFGSVVTRDALPLVAIITLNASTAQVGMLSAAGALPALLIGLPAGVWVDRWRRRPVLIAADLLRAGLLLTIPVAALLGWLGLVQLVAVAFLAGIMTIFFDVADNSYLPSLVQRKHLLEGNSKLGTTSSLAEVGGSAVTGLLVQLLTAPAAIFVDVFTYLASALLLSRIRQSERAPEAPTTAPGMRREIVEGLRLVSRSDILRNLAVSAALRTFFGSFIGALYSLFAIRILKLPPSVLGLLIASGGIGSLLGAALAGRAVNAWGLGRLLSGALLLRSATLLLLPLAALVPAVAVPLLIIDQIVGDTLLTTFLINEISLRQSVTPDRLLGRTNATMSFIVVGLAPLGLLLGGLLGEIAGVMETLLIAAAGIFTAGLWLFFSPVQRLRTYPVQPDSDLLP